MNILRPFSKTTHQNRYIIIITDTYLKLTRVVLTCKTTPTNIVNLFLNSWLVPYGIHAYLLTDIDVQHTNKIFATICTFLVAKQVATTVNHLQTINHVKRYNKPIFFWLRYSVEELFKNPVTFVQLSTHLYIAQIRLSSNQTSWGNVLAWHSPERTLQCADSVDPTHAYGKHPPSYCTQDRKQVFANYGQKWMLAKRILEQRDKKDYNCRVYKTTQLTPKNVVFVSRLLLSAIKEYDALALL